MSDVTHVFVIDQLHELEFPVGPLRVCHVLKGSRQFLDRHILCSDGVIRRAATEMEFKIDCPVAGDRRSSNL
jgi:hypothetical protein